MFFILKFWWRRYGQYFSKYLWKIVRSIYCEKIIKKKKQTSYGTVTSFSIYLPRSLFFICLFSLFVTNLSRASSFLMKDNLFPIKRNIDLSSSWFIKTYTCSRGLFSIVEEILTILRNVLWIEHPTKWNVENHIIKERKLFSFVQLSRPKYLSSE